MLWLVKRRETALVQLLDALSAVRETLVADLDLARSKPTDAGLYVGSFEPELDPLAVQTYKRNHPGVRVWQGDIRNLTAAEWDTYLGGASSRITDSARGVTFTCSAPLRSAVFLRNVLFGTNPSMSSRILGCASENA